MPAASRWVAPYAAATRARSRASVTSSPRRATGTATSVAGGIRSRAARMVRINASGDSPSGPSVGHRHEDEHVAGDGARGVRDLGQLGRWRGRSAMTPSTRPGGSSGLISSGPSRNRRNDPCRLSPMRRTGPPTPLQPSRTGHTSTASMAASGAPSRSVSVSARLSGLAVSMPSTSALGTSSVIRTGHGVPSASRPVRPIDSRSARVWKPVNGASAPERRSSRSASSRARGA